MGKLLINHFTSASLKDLGMHVAAWYHKTPGLEFTKFEE